jgi:hypothetical protein
MTLLLEQALEAARSLPPGAQDEIARVVLRLAGTADEGPPIRLTESEQQAIDRSKVAAARGAFASDDAVRAVWGRYGL